MKQNIKEPRLLDLQWVRRALLLFLGDVVIIIMASVGALIARFDFSYSSIDAVYLESMYRYLPIHIFTTVLYFIFVKCIIVCGNLSVFMNWVILYWQILFLFYADCRLSFDSVSNTEKLFFCGNFVADSNGCRNTIFLSFLPIPERGEGTALWLRGEPQKRVMIIGAGDAGRVIIKEILDSRFLTMKVCCVIDDDCNKTGRYINGIPIVGDRFAILKNVEKYKIDKIILAIPSASKEERREILEICKMTKCELKTLPGYVSAY